MSIGSLQYYIPMDFPRKKMLLSGAGILGGPLEDATLLPSPVGTLSGNEHRRERKGEAKKP